MMTQQTPLSGGAASEPQGRGPRRAVDRRREDLIEAAIAVLAERGLAGATTRAITQRAGLALGAFHYAFTSKDELLAAVMERMASTIDRLRTDPVADAVPVRSPGAPAEPVATLRDLLARLWQILEEEPNEQLAQFELALHARREPGLLHLAGQRQERLIASIAGVIRTAPGQLDEAASQELARSVADHLDGLLLHRLIEDDPDEGRRRLERYLLSLDAVVTAHAGLTPRANDR
ncbi:MAG: TetR/AcrR family transcriptional regulator [Nitriliruptoraceae bacterium]